MTMSFDRRAARRGSSLPCKAHRPSPGYNHSRPGRGPRFHHGVHACIPRRTSGGASATCSAAASAQILFISSGLISAATVFPASKAATQPMARVWDRSAPLAPPCVHAADGCGPSPNGAPRDVRTVSRGVPGVSVARPARVRALSVLHGGDSEAPMRFASHPRECHERRVCCAPSSDSIGALCTRLTASSSPVGY